MALDELLKKTEITHIDTYKAQYVDEVCKTILGGQSATSIGSSNRETYVPNSYGLPDDIDVQVVAPQLDIGQYITDFYENKKAQLERVLSNIYQAPITVTLLKSENNKEFGYKQVMLEAKDAHDNKLLKCDINFSDTKDESEEYPNAFDVQLDSLTQYVEEKIEAQHWLKANIRGLKCLLQERGIYKTKEGGFGGVGCEQLVLQLHDGYAPRSFEELQSMYNVGSALQRLHDDNGMTTLHKYINEGDELIQSKLGRNNGRGRHTLLKRTKDYKRFMYTQSLPEYQWSDMPLVA